LLLTGAAEAEEMEATKRPKKSESNTLGDPDWKLGNTARAPELTLSVTVMSQSHIFKSLNFQIWTSQIWQLEVTNVEKGESYVLPKLPHARDGQKLLFKLLFLKDDEDQSVEVEEVEEIDFRRVEKHLAQGESVFITPKRAQKLNNSLVAWEDTTELWYFSHIWACVRK
jgi:hypothetical protein